MARKSVRMATGISSRLVFAFFSLTFSQLLCAHLYGVGKTRSLPLGMPFSKVGGYYDSLSFAQDFGYTVSRRDPPVHAALTKNAVYTIAESTRFLVAWGHGYFGNAIGASDGTWLRNPTRLDWELATFPGLARASFESVAAADDGSFVALLTSEETVWTFGSNSRGQLGRNTGASIDSNPGQVSVPKGIASLHAGEDFIIGFLKNGSLIGWGSNAFGVLGRDPSTLSSSQQPILIVGPTVFVSVSVGAQHIIACGEDGGVYTWGRGQSGELGVDIASLPNGYRWIPTRVNSGALSGTSYTCTRPLAGWNATIVFLQLPRPSPCTAVFFGLKESNSLPDTMSSADDFIELPQQADNLCYSKQVLPFPNQTFSVLSAGFRHRHGFTIFGDRTLVRDTAMSSWGPLIAAELLDDRVSDETLNNFDSGDAAGNLETFYLYDLMDRRSIRGPLRIFVGATSFLLVASDGTSYIWGFEVEKDMLLRDTQGPSTQEASVDSIVRLDHIGFLSRRAKNSQFQSKVKEIASFMPSPDGDSLDTVLIISDAWDSDRTTFEVAGDWWAYPALDRTYLPRPTVLKPDTISLSDPSVAKLHSYGVGAKHIIILADCEPGVRCLLTAGDPDGTWGQLGYDDIYWADPSLAAHSLLALEPSDASVPPENQISLNSMTMVAAGARSSWVVVNSNQLWWWGEFGNLAENYPVRFNVATLSGASIVKISIGYNDNGFIISGDGGLFAFGDNAFLGRSGRLCTGTTVAGFVPTLIRINPSPGLFFRDVHAGGEVVIATSRSSAIVDFWVCGRADALGLDQAFNASVNGYNPSFINQTFISGKPRQDGMQVKAGAAHVAVLLDGSVVSFGRNDAGQCGVPGNNVIWTPQMLQDSRNILSGRTINGIATAPTATYLISNAYLLFGPQKSTFIASSVSDIFELEGVSVTPQSDDIRITVVNDAAVDPWYSPLMTRLVRTLVSETADVGEFSLEIAAQSSFSNRITGRLRLVNVILGFSSFDVMRHISAFMNETNRRDIAFRLLFEQNDATETSPTALSTVYFTRINGCASTSCQKVPKNAQTITITGTGFGNDTTVLSVRLSPSGICFVQSANDTTVTCRLASELPIGELKAQVFRGPAPRLIESWDAYLTTFAIVVNSSSVVTSVSPLPWNAPFLIFNASELDGVSPLELKVLLPTGSECPVIENNRGNVKCNASKLLSSDTRGPLAIQLFRATAPSPSTVVATIVDKPSLDTNPGTKIAQNSPTATIKGSNLGDDPSVISVILTVGPSQRRMIYQDFSASIVSLSDTSITIALPTASLSTGSTLTATVFRSQAPSDPVFLGSIVAAPNIVTNTALQVAQSAVSVTINGAGFSATLSDVQVVLEQSNRAWNCTITSSSPTSIVCSLPPSVEVGPLSATVTAFGGRSNVAQVASIVPAPVVKSASPVRIGETVITIVGEGFDATGQNIAQLSYDVTNTSATFDCSVDTSKTTAQQIVCTTASGSIAGTLSARIQSFGGFSNWTQIALVSLNDGVATQGGLPTGAIIAIAVVASIGVVAIIIAAVLIRRYFVNLRLRNEMNVPKEMEYMFNIRASDLEIYKKLGEGSFGAVYFARYKGKHVAVKKLAATALGHQVADFFREASLMGAIKPHPNVVRTYGMCQELGHFSMVMEFLSGGSLDSLLAEMKTEGESIPELQRFKIIYGIANGMAHLASSGIVHRDLAARNVLLDDSHEQPRISDFGFSRIVGDNEAEYSEKSDVWSFGVVLFEIIEGAEPYQNEDILSIAVAIRDSARNPIAELTVRPPAYLRTLMEMCFASDPSVRPSFKQIVEFLENHAPAGFIPPAAASSGSAAIVEKKNSKKKKPNESSSSRSSSSSSSSESSSDEESSSAEQQQQDQQEPFAPKTQTNKTNKPRWSQALPKDRNTIMDQMRLDEQIQQNTVKPGYQDANELQGNEDTEQK